MLVAALAGLLAVACGGSSQVTAVATASARPSVASSPSASPSPSVSPAPVIAYSGQLTMSGGVSGKFAVVAPSGAASAGCGNGEVDVAIVVKGAAWNLNASASAYSGPGTYRVGDAFSILISTPSADLWFTTGGTAVYLSDRSVTINVDATNMMAGPGEPGANVHITGTMSCG